MTKEKKPPTKPKTLFPGKKIALCLPGGGAKGAFQAGVLNALKPHNPKYNWIAGVSVGGLNGAMVSTGQHDEMVKLWQTVRLKDVARKRSYPRMVWEYLKYKVGITHPPQALYSNDPLMELLVTHLSGKKFQIPFMCGSVNIATGDYNTWKYVADRQYQVRVSRGVMHNKLVSHKSGNLPEYSRRAGRDIDYLAPILATTAVPAVWDPVKIDEEWHVDGGIRNINPIKDLIMYDPDVILVIPTERGGGKPGNIGSQLDILESVRRTMAVMLNEIFQNDISECRKINRLVKQAEDQGVDLLSSTGRKLKHYELHVIDPGSNLGDAMDFRRETLDHRFRKGENAARRFLRSQGIP